jgi:hypothetical protein
MAKKKAPASTLPKGFKALSQSLAGFFIMEEGNTVQGVLHGTFMVKSKFHKEGKLVYRIEVTHEHETRIMSKDTGESEAAIGDIIGLDNKGWLGALSRVGVGQVVYVKCLGKGPGEKDPWKFETGVLEQEEFSA